MPADLHHPRIDHSARATLFGTTAKNMKSLNTLTQPLLPFRASIAMAAVLSITVLQGCAVVAVVDTVGTVAVKTVGLAADAAIGAVKITGRAVGAAADAVIPGEAAP
ncbi:MAG: hypothetical protein ACKVOT_09005 [Polaromonas sp.]